MRMPKSRRTQVIAGRHIIHDFTLHMHVYMVPLTVCRTSEPLSERGSSLALGIAEHVVLDPFRRLLGPSVWRCGRIAKVPYGKVLPVEYDRKEIESGSESD